MGRQGAAILSKSCREEDWVGAHWRMASAAKMHAVCVASVAASFPPLLAFEEASCPAMPTTCAVKLRACPAGRRRREVDRAVR